MREYQVVINGEYVPAHKAVLHISDLAIERGYGIFDYFKTVKGKPVFWEDNLDRFFRSAEKMDLPVAYSRESLKEQITRLMDLNRIPESGIKITLTGGYSSDAYTIEKPNLIIAQHPLQRGIEKEKKGMRLMRFNFHRQIGTVKTIDYVMGIRALAEARKKGFDDVVYAQNGILSECPRANIFLVAADGSLLTPGGDVLSGITRKHILEMTAGKIPSQVRDLTQEDVKNAKEAFITSTSKNITPVLSIDDIVYGNEPGPVTRALQKQWDALVYDA